MSVAFGGIRPGKPLSITWVSKRSDINLSERIRIESSWSSTGSDYSMNLRRDRRVLDPVEIGLVEVCSLGHLGRWEYWRVSICKASMWFVSKVFHSLKGGWGIVSVDSGFLRLHNRYQVFVGLTQELPKCIFRPETSVGLLDPSLAVKWDINS